MNAIEFKTEPTIIEIVVARQMYSRMSEGIVYTLDRRGEVRRNPYTRHYELLICNAEAEDMELVVSSKDGHHVALVALVNYDANGWVERRLEDIGKGDATAQAAEAQDAASVTVQ